jgi:hypothetical protein
VVLPPVRVEVAGAGEGRKERRMSIYKTKQVIELNCPKCNFKHTYSGTMIKLKQRCKNCGTMFFWNRNPEKRETQQSKGRSIATPPVAPRAVCQFCGQNVKTTKSVRRTVYRQHRNLTGVACQGSGTGVRAAEKIRAALTPQPGDVEIVDQP